jgi:hypothetical protein
VNLYLVDKNVLIPIIAISINKVWTELSYIGLNILLKIGHSIWDNLIQYDGTRTDSRHCIPRYSVFNDHRKCNFFAVGNV